MRWCACAVIPSAFMGLCVGETLIRSRVQAAQVDGDGASGAVEGAGAPLPRSAHPARTRAPGSAVSTGTRRVPMADLLETVAHSGTRNGAHLLESRTLRYPSGMSTRKIAARKKPEHCRPVGMNPAQSRTLRFCQPWSSDIEMSRTRMVSEPNRIPIGKRPGGIEFRTVYYRNTGYRGVSYTFRYEIPEGILSPIFRKIRQ